MSQSFRIRSTSVAKAVLAFACLALCGGAMQAGAPAGTPRNPIAWTIGPVIKGRNYSVRMPLHPSPSAQGEWQIDLPRAPGSVHYVTYRHGSLAGKRHIVLRYRIEAAPGVRIVPTTNPALPSIITLYFQRRGDTWTGRGQYETYRWYATFASHMPITPGDHVITAPLDGAWTAVGTSTARTAPAAFRAAIADADQVGFVLGGGDGYGHGVHATGRARMIVKSFSVK